MPINNELTINLIYKINKKICKISIYFDIIILINCLPCVDYKNLRR